MLGSDVPMQSPIMSRERKERARLEACDLISHMCPLVTEDRSDYLKHPVNLNLKPPHRARICQASNIWVVEALKQTGTKPVYFKAHNN